MSRDQQRRSVRLPNYDYAQAGTYFVTICTYGRQVFFEHTSVRAIAEQCWRALPEHFPLVTLDEWVVMPNHVHGIIVITDGRDDSESHAAQRRGVQLNAPTADNIDHHVSRDPTNRHSLISPQRNTLAVIVRTYKAAVTTCCRREDYADFQWQRNYYERVIRDTTELNHTRQYIIDNPANWNKDDLHPLD